MRVGCQVAIVYAVTHGFLNNVPVAEVPAYEQALYEKLENAYAPLLERFESNYFEPEDIETLEAALNSMQRW